MRANMFSLQQQHQQKQQQKTINFKHYVNFSWKPSNRLFDSKIEIEQRRL